MVRSLRYVVKGRVQGVFFRKFTQQNAERLGIVGWVKNHWDGSVVGVAEGEDNALAEFQEAIGRGPRWAVVEKVDITEEVEIGQCQFAAFEIRH